MFRKKKVLTEEQAEEIRIQEFFDRIIPGTVRFFTDHFICGNHYKCVWALEDLEFTEIPGNPIKVKSDTLQYFILTL